MYGVPQEETVTGRVWILDHQAKIVCDDFVSTLEECWSYGLQRATVRAASSKQAQVSASPSYLATTPSSTLCHVFKYMNMYDRS